MSNKGLGGGLFIFLLFILLPFVVGEKISLNPCESKITITEDDTFFYMKSACFDIQFTKKYDSKPIIFNDIYNKNFFELKLVSLVETDFSDNNKNSILLLEELGMTGKIEGSSIIYSTPDKKYQVIYTIRNNRLEADMIINNWDSIYEKSVLELKTRIDADEKSDSSFISVASYVDDAKQEEVVSKVEVEGEEKYLIQKLYEGSSFNTLYVDPVYQVDYTPQPAILLIDGNVMQSNSLFASTSNVTSILSDNNTGTYVNLFEYNLVNTPYSSSNEGGSNLTSYTIAVGGTNIEINMDYSAGKYGRVTLGGGNYFTNNSVITFYMRPKDASAVNKNIILTTNAGVQVGSFNTGTDTSNFQYRYATLSNVPSAISTLRFHESVAGDNYKVFYDYIKTEIADYDSGTALQVRFSQTYDPQFHYFIVAYINSVGMSNLSVHAYLNETHISPQSEQTETDSNGYFYINVTGLVDYQTNTLALGYTSFRIFTSNDQQISEIYLLKEINDTQPPIISDCFSNVSYLGCGESALLQCNVTDNVGMEDVFFHINNSNHTTIKNNDIFYYIFSPLGEVETILTWDNVHAVDILGLESNYNPNININYSCCFEDWVEGYDSCQTNDSQLKTYTDTHSCGTYDDLPVDNGTYVYCNYCYEDLQSHYNTECSSEGTREIDWDDDNYFSCCAMTGLVSDCSILYSPYNETYLVNCTFLSNDFELYLDSEVFFGFGIGGLKSDKTHGKIWINDSNTTYSCISYVKTMAGNVVQTNPPYTKRTDSTFQLIPKEIEDREFFTTSNGLANVYWTSDNLVIDGRTYYFGVECSGGGNHLVSETASVVLYDSVNAPITRWFWIKENMTGIMLGLIIFVIIIFIIAWAMSNLRGR